MSKPQPSEEALEIIDSDAVDSSERWELPSFDGARRKPGRVEDEAPKLPTAQEIAAIRDAAHQEGFEQGYQEGQQKAQQEYQQLAKAFDNLMSQMSTPFKQQEEALGDEIAELAMMASRHIIRRELQLEPQQIIAVIRESIKLLPSYRRQVMVQLHPDDAKIVREIFSINQQESNSWMIADDPSVTRGGCLITTDSSRVDATLEKRIAELFGHLFGDLRERSGEGESDDIA